MDLEMWHALHDECGPIGCGNCVVFDLDVTDEIIRAAAIAGESVDVFIHRAVIMGMEHERVE